MAYRKIIINGSEWSYKVGKTYTKFRSPARKSSAAPNYQVKGLDGWDLYERGKWKGNPSGMVMPSDIERYITLNLMPT